MHPVPQTDEVPAEWQQIFTDLVATDRAIARSTSTAERQRRTIGCLLPLVSRAAEIIAAHAAGPGFREPHSRREQFIVAMTIKVTLALGKVERAVARWAAAHT